MQTSDCRILWRTAAKKIQAFLQGSTRKELLVTGARQVGKTTLIRQLGREAFPNFVELNFLENTAARKLFETASDSSDFLLRRCDLDTILRWESQAREFVVGKSVNTQSLREFVSALKHYETFAQQKLASSARRIN